MKSNKRPALIILALMMVFTSTITLMAAGTEDGLTESAGQVSWEAINAKYVFVFIGDGMSMTQINAAEIFTNALSSKDITISKLGFTQFPVSGLTTTFDAGSFITDSASAGTAITTGYKTLSGVINMDPSRTVAYKTIAEYAKEAGRNVGVISSVSLDHATPASFYAKVPSRGNMYDIAVQLAESDLDFFGGGGFAQPTGRNRDQESVFDILARNGYTYVNDPEAFRALKPGSGKVVAVNQVLQDSNAMPYELDRAADDLSLADYTAKAIELLKADNGFLIAVESGKIDWACHANDAAAAIFDTIAFDRAIAEATAFYRQHPDDTLIVVTGDHETGGMTIGFAGTKYSTFFDKVGAQKGSYVKFTSEILAPYKKGTGEKRLSDLLPAIGEYFGITLDQLTSAQQEQLARAFERSMGNEIVRAVQEDVYLLYGGYDPLTVKCTQLVNQLAGIGWTSYSHTGVPVATFALGRGQELFGGYYDNTEIFSKLMQVMGLDRSAVAAVR